MEVSRTGEGMYQGQEGGMLQQCYQYTISLPRLDLSIWTCASKLSGLRIQSRAVKAYPWEEDKCSFGTSPPTKVYCSACSGGLSAVLGCGLDRIGL